jgi:hypothetical protein
MIQNQKLKLYQEELSLAMRYEASIIPVCPDCEQEHELNTKQCERCGIIYCHHYSSPTDTRFCGNCLADFHVLETIETKTTVHTNDAGEVTYTRRQTAKNLKLEGTDWLFSAAKIPTLTDEELLATIEYHGALKSMMLQEREARHVERYRKLASIKIIGPPRHVLEQDELDAQRAGKPIPKHRKATVVKTVAAPATAEQAVDMLKKLQAAGFTAEMLKALIGGKK